MKTTFYFCLTLLLMSCGSIPKRISSSMIDWTAVPADFATDHARRANMITKLKELSQYSTEQIEEGLVKHAARLQADKNINRVNEAVKSLMLCFVLFEHPKGSRKLAGKNIPLHGLFFFEDEGYDPEEIIEYSFPVQIQQNGNIEIQGRFAGYTGAPPPPDFGLKYFRYCKTHYQRRQKPNKGSGFVVCN